MKFFMTALGTKATTYSIDERIATQEAMPCKTIVGIIKKISTVLKLQSYL